MSTKKVMANLPQHPEVTTSPDAPRVNVPIAVIETKPWYQSKTLIFNGVLLVGVTGVQVIDVLTGANVIEPLVKIFVKDPEQVTHILTVITQVYTLVNLYLRGRTKQPISF